MNTAFLVRLSISQWTARRLDKTATRDTKDRAGASGKAKVAVYKTVLAADALDKIESLASAARIEHRKRTTPWQWDGASAITAEGFPAYRAAMTGLEKEFNAAVVRFIAEYEQDRHSLLTDAANPMRVGLGNLFNPADYPYAAELAQKFSFVVAVEPMPQPEHFNARLPLDMVNEIRHDIIENNAVALDNANQSAWTRVIEAVEKLKLKLEGYKPAANGKNVEGKFHDSLIENIKELAELIPSINIAQDPELTRMGQKLIALTAYDANDLRQSDALRIDIAKQAGLVLAGISEAYKKAA